MTGRSAIRLHTVKYNRDQTVSDLRDALAMVHGGVAYKTSLSNALRVLNVIETKQDDLPRCWRSSPPAWFEALFAAYEIVSIVARERPDTEDLAIGASLAAWNIAQRADVDQVRRRRSAMTHLVALAAAESLPQLGARLRQWKELEVGDVSDSLESIEYGIRVHNYLSGSNEIDRAIDIAGVLASRAESADQPGTAAALNSAVAHLYMKRGQTRPDLVARARDLLDQAPEFPQMHYYYWLCQAAVIIADQRDAAEATEYLDDAELLARSRGYSYSALLRARIQVQELISH